MGHYDDCRASEYASGLGKVTKKEKKWLRKIVKKQGGIYYGYDEDFGDVRKKFIALEDKKLKVESNGYKRFVIKKK